MKKILLILCLAFSFVFVACNQDDPEADYKGYINVKLFVSEITESEDEIDYSDYEITITPMQGWAWTATMGEIEWPLEFPVGEYIVAASSPKLSETLTSETYYLGKREKVKILKDNITDITLTLKRETIEK